MLRSAYCTREHTMSIFVADDVNLDHSGINGVCQNYQFDLAIPNNIITMYFEGIISRLCKYSVSI